MDQTAAREFLFKQLDTQVPNEEICRVATKEQIERIAAEIDFEPIKVYFETGSLGLTIRNVPSDLWFKLTLWSILITESFEDGSILYEDSKIWDLEDQRTKKILESLKQNMKQQQQTAIGEIRLEDYLAYIKSLK